MQTRTEYVASSKKTKMYAQLRIASALFNDQSAMVITCPASHESDRFKTGRYRDLLLATPQIVIQQYGTGETSDVVDRLSSSLTTATLLRLPEATIDGEPYVDVGSAAGIALVADRVMRQTCILTDGTTLLMVCVRNTAGRLPEDFRERLKGCEKLVVTQVNRGESLRKVLTDFMERRAERFTRFSM